MEKLEKLMERCKCGVFLTVNEHRDYYQTAQEKLDEARGYECPPEIDDDVRRVMTDTNTIIVCQFYPDTPIGSYEVWHYDLNKCLDECLVCVGL